MSEEDDPFLIEAEDELREALWGLQEERQERIAKAIEDIIDVKIVIMFEKFTNAALGEKK